MEETTTRDERAEGTARERPRNPWPLWPEECHGHRWSVEGCWCTECGVANRSEHHLATCGPCDLSVREAYAS